MSVRYKIIFSIVFISLYVFVCSLIIHYSLEDSVESTETSNGVTDVIEDAVETITSNKVDVNREKLSKYVRELIGHFGLFALSAFLGILGFVYIFKKQYLNITFVSLIGFNLTIMTELIQKDVEGRIFDVKDILINCLGIIFGIIVSKILLMLIIHSVNKRKNKNFVDKCINL